MKSVLEICDHALWLDKGHMVMRGDAETVADAYMERESRENTVV